VSHYIEVIFSLYDYNEDGFLSGRELMSAFPRFNGFLANAVREKTHSTKSVATLKAIFAYIIENRNFPEHWWEKIGIGISGWGYSNDPNVLDDKFPDADLDRGGILQVLVMLNNSSGAPDDLPNGAEVKECPAHWRWAN
jgi:hypothetical protein